MFLFQSVLLMQKSDGAKFVGIGSPMGSIEAWICAHLSHDGVWDQKGDFPLDRPQSPLRAPGVGERGCGPRVSCVVLLPSLEDIDE